MLPVGAVRDLEPAADREEMEEARIEHQRAAEMPLRFYLVTSSSIIRTSASPNASTLSIWALFA
jgi:hypothetical protein